ncbi:MAG: hypothetical protein Q9174_000827 [Haloplaca sp. 1 TL-2023]
MASNVVVIDASARRVTIKTTPTKILSDILQEACAKLGADANIHGLQHNNKKLDLSNPVRLSGLSPGAKLELLVLSRSPSVVSVALQLPESEADGVPSGRLIDKFPSSTTLWLILRKFESMAPQRNYTGRGKTRTLDGDSGAGRLFHEAPVFGVLGRELTSFTDLQKTLAQLGYNDGSVLLRLKFRVSETPLEEAMEQIERYFKSTQSDEASDSCPTGKSTDVPLSDIREPMSSGQGDNNRTPPEPASLGGKETACKGTLESEQTSPRPESQQPTTDIILGPGQRPVTVLRPSSSSTPRAAQQAFNEGDYEPTIAHAKLHQARLQSSGRNQSLLSDKELADRSTAKAQRMADVKEISVRVRYPDGNMVNARFSNLETAQTLYDHAKGLLKDELEEESFLLHLGFLGNTLVNLSWEDPSKPLTQIRPVIKSSILEVSKEIEVPELPEVNTPEEPIKDPSPGKQRDNGKSGGKEAMPKWLKGLARK